MESGMPGMMALFDNFRNTTIAYEALYDGFAEDSQLLY
jgi:hypothetical protein